MEESSSQTPALATSHGAPFDYEVVSEEMESRWPHLFGHGIHLPLKVGITKDLHQEALANGSSLSKRKISLYLESGTARIRGTFAKSLTGVLGMTSTASPSTMTFRRAM